MTPTGQYQLAISTGVPSSNIYVSSDYGASWVNRSIFSTNNAGRWTESLCINTTGQYMFVGGGGGAGAHIQYSKDYGIIEDMHSTLMHNITNYLKLQLAELQTQLQ